MIEIELNSLDLRYEHLRLKDKPRERRLLSLIAECGIKNPLLGVMIEDRAVLLDGFKRYRCAKRLSIMIVPFLTIGQNQDQGLLSLLARAHQKHLSILEQASFIDELKVSSKLCPAEIAARLNCSKTWVNTRLGLLEEMSASIRHELFSGAFPVCAYMQTLRPMMRKDRASKKKVEAFVKALRGRQLSVRDIQQLVSCLSNKHTKSARQNGAKRGVPTGVYLDDTRPEAERSVAPFWPQPSGSWFFWPVAVLLVGQRSLRISSLLAPCPRPKLLTNFVCLFERQDTSRRLFPGSAFV